MKTLQSMKVTDTLLEMTDMLIRVRGSDYYLRFIQRMNDLTKKQSKINVQLTAIVADIEKKYNIDLGLGKNETLEDRLRQEGLKSLADLLVLTTKG